MLLEDVYKEGISMETMIKQTLMQSAENFALYHDEEALRNNDIQMKAPLLFVLLGDKVQEDIKELKQAVEQSMSNSEGIIYLCIGNRSKEDVVSDTVTVYLNQEVSAMNRGELTKVLEQDTFLKSLNGQLEVVRQSILEKNKVFSCWEQMHISVITAASDPINVLLPDITVLVKNKLEQNFKQVFVDLFVLLEETGEDAIPINRALSYSLFQELDIYQNREYHYEKPTELLDEEIKLMTKQDGQLFHLIYLLSDQKENGQKINEARKSHYETIVAVNLLKNRQNQSMELEEAREQYNYNNFITNIREGAENRYCTARLARVKKPGQGIYLTVIYQLFKLYEKELSYEGHDEESSLMEKVGLSEGRIETLVRSWMPEKEGLDAIKSLMSRRVSFKEVRNVTFLEAENSLYGESAKEFFKINFTDAAYKKMANYLQEEHLREKMTEDVISQSDYGPFALGELLKSASYSILENQKERYLYQIKQYEAEKEEKENRLVGQCVGGNFSLFEKKYLQDTKAYLIDEVYKARYDYEMECLKLKALQGLQEGLENLNKELKVKLRKLEQVEKLLLEMIAEANRYEEEYLVQNVKEYYARVVEERIEELKKVKGAHFLLEEKYMGNQLLDESEETIINRLTQIARQEILSVDQYFNISFEEELLARANMLVEYEETEVVAKSELYELLYESLEENSKPCVYLDTTLATHRYIEKYFLGNRESEFIDYAYRRDQSSRNYKIGTVNDKRKSVIEKLQLMGGFKLEDLVYVRSAKRYYDAYKEKGYTFHSEEMIEQATRED